MSACYIVIPGSWVLYGYYIGPGSQELAGAAFGPWPCHGGMWHTKKKIALIMQQFGGLSV